MKMKPGPKAILILVVAGGLIGFGFWAGRGFPKTLEGAIHLQPTATAAAPQVDLSRVESLESRVGSLEQDVATLRVDLNASRTAAPANAARPTEPAPAPADQTDNSEPQSRQ